MTTTNYDQAAQLKAAAIAARRAARAPWQNAHVDRLAREREARETARAYRQAQTLGTKQCSRCSEVLVLDCFSPAFRDRPTARCKSCVAAVTRERYKRDLDKARARTRHRPAPRVSTEERGRRAAERRQKVEELQRQKAERQREIAARMAHLTGLLTGTGKGERITSEQGWDMTTSELQRLWAHSGDKVCVQCKAAVPPSAMMPPGPANFYPGQCRSCARISSEGSHRRTYGPLIGPLTGPPKLLMQDGSRITLAEFARRVEERQTAYANRRGS